MNVGKMVKKVLNKQVIKFSFFGKRDYIYPNFKQFL
jgi:hypothetical protein